MKATDLMPNDWVYIQEDGYGYHDQIEGVDARHSMCWTSDKDDIDIADIMPIRIAEEMLRLNGLIKAYNLSAENEPTWHSIDGRLILDSDDIWIKGVKLPITLKYVHQLQHALRLCGLNKLADNWKVR